MHAFRAWSRVIWTKAIWRPIWRPELDHKVGIFVKKSISQKLKKSKKFSFRNSPLTRQHSISLNGTNSKDIRSRVSEMFYQRPKHARLVSCQCDATVLSTTVWRKPFSKEMTFWWYLKQNWTTQMSNSRYIASMEMQDLNTNLVSLWVTAVNLQGTVLLHFETILKHAERLDYEIQDILYGNAWFERECESFEGLWVNLAFYRESDTAGAIKTSVSIYKSWNWMISICVWDYQVKNNYQVTCSRCNRFR